MSTQTDVLNFKNLSSLPPAKLHETIPPDRAVQLTLDSYKSREASIEEIYKSWATSLFQQYGHSNININDLNQLLGVFSLAVKELLHKRKEDINEAEAIKLIAFLDYSLELFTWIRSVANEIVTHEITAFLCFGLCVVQSFLDVISNGKKVSKVLEKSLAIHAIILGILTENSKLFSFDNKSSNLIQHLCAIGEVTPKLDIKTAVDTWKVIARLSSQNAAPSKKNPSNDSDWLKRPMAFLTSEIGRNVQITYQENSLNEPIEQVEKYLKVTNFYLRLLQKITTDFRHVAFPVCKEFVDTLVATMNPPVYILKTPVEKVVTDLITKGLKELVPFVYRNPSFFEHLLNKDVQISNDSGVFQEVLFEIMEVAIRRNEAECLNHSHFNEAFERCLRNRQLYASISTYNRFIEVFSALQTYYRLDIINETLVKSVLQDDIVAAMSAIDIWCTIFSSSKLPRRVSCFTFWRDINEQFAKFSTRARALYTEILLKKLYTLLTNQEKLGIWSKFDVRALYNDRFLLAVGLDAIPSIPVKQAIIQYFKDELQRLLKESSNHMAVDNFYTIVKDLKLLTPVAFQNIELTEMLLRYLEVAIKNRKFSLLVEGILDFIAPRLDSVDDSKILKILTGLSMELCRFQDYSTRVSFVRFLRRVSKNSNLTEHSEGILRVVETNKLVKYLGSFETTPQMHETVKGRPLESNGLNHVSPFEDDWPAKKKMKTQTDHLLESIESSVNQLQALTQMDELNSSKVETIKRVVYKLQRIGGLS